MSYVPTDWHTGDLIIAETLNNLENGIPNDLVVNVLEDDNVVRLSATWQEIKDAVDNAQQVQISSLSAMDTCMTTSNISVYYDDDSYCVKCMNTMLFVTDDPDEYPVLHVDTNCLMFFSEQPFSLTAGDITWDGTLEYSTDRQTWSIWDGSTINSVYGNLFLRGTGNSYVKNPSTHTPLISSTASVSCTGNIETLLDYQTVVNNEHPVMTTDCYYRMFSGCTSLVTAPELPAITLVRGCYSEMFRGCTSLVTAPDLPATTLANGCYSRMFMGCTSLVALPELPATTLTTSCYSEMFSGCTSLATAPELSATTLATACCFNMFYGCTSLATAPQLPATTLAISCYSGMFSGCTSLATLPQLPATTLANSCYDTMFSYCTSIKLSTTQTDEYQYEYRIPIVGTGTDAQGHGLTDMFVDTGGTFTGTPEINRTYYTTNQPV